MLQPDSSFQTFGAGMSFGSPFGAPAATHARIVSICSSLSDRSFLNFWMPTVLSMCHGGIWRAPTRDAIDFAHGRASSYEISDIGAMLSGRWHDSHFCWKIGATSLVNVGVFGASAAAAGTAAASSPPNASAIETRNITVSFQPSGDSRRRKPAIRPAASIVLAIIERIGRGACLVLSLYGPRRRRCEV